LIPGPEKLSTTAIGGTFVNVKAPLESTALDTLVPTTVTITPGVPSVRLREAVPFVTPDSVPVMVAPEATDVGAGAVATDGAVLGAVGEP